MLSLKDVNGKLIQKWKTNHQIKPIVFAVHKTDILHVYESTDSITIFYGFLDQDYEKNAAQFIDSVFKNKGIAGLNDCYGSFIILHYDVSSQEYTLTNDALGDFAAHYYESDDSIEISDLPDLILNKSNSTINQDRLLHYFAVTKPQNNVSFFKSIKQVNPGHYLSITNNKLETKQYYHPPESINYKNTSIDDLSQQFNTIMQLAIKYQTQGHDHIGVMMSGGLDSTFVTGHALQVGKKISTYSYVFPNIPQANEAIWIDSMRKLNIEMNTFVGEPYWPLKTPWYASINSPVNNPYRHMKDVIYRQAQSKNIKLLLTGVFADHLYTGYIYWLVDMAKRNPLKAIKQLYSTMRQHGVKTGLRQVAPKKWSKSIKSTSTWLSSQARTRLKEIQSTTRVYKHAHPEQFALAYGLSSAQDAWLDHEHGNKHDLYVRDPFRDRRVVEFLMSTPAWILGTFDSPKRLVRKSAQGLLPDAILRRNKQTTLTPLFVKGVLEKEFDKTHGLLTGSATSWQNFINKDLIYKILKNPSKDYQDSDYMILWQCLSYEMWIKRLESSKF